MALPSERINNNIAAPLVVVAAVLALCASSASAFIPHAPVSSRPSSPSSSSSSTRSTLSRQATPTSTPPSPSPRQRAQTKYTPKGWDREMYRPPDQVLFEWQELLCCLKFMEEKEVNAGMLAPETRDMMIGYADALIKYGSPVRTLEGLAEAMKGRWKLAFTTEERYKILPPGTRVYYDIHRDDRLENVMKFKDKYWESLVSSAKYNLTPQGRLVFDFTSNHVNINSPFSTTGQQWKLPLPQNVGNLGTAFADVSYMDGVMWIEKIRDPATDSVFCTIYEYIGPLQGEERASPLSFTSSSLASSSKGEEVEGLASGTQSLVAFLEGLEREEQEELAEKKRKEEEEGREGGAGAGAAELESSPPSSSKVSA